MKCIHCNKDLPVGSESRTCSLCAIGLIPTAPVSSEAGMQFQASHVVEGRTLSGVHCPGCHAEFSMADINNCHCSICGAAFSQERIDHLVNQVRFERQQMPEMPLKPRELGQHSWPDDAPLW